MTPDQQAVLNALKARTGQFEAQNSRLAAGQPMPPVEQAVADSIPDPDVSQDPVVGHMLAMRANAANKPVLRGLPDPEVPATKPSSRPWQPEISSVVPEGFDGQSGMQRLMAADVARNIAARQEGLGQWDAAQIAQSGMPGASASEAWQMNRRNMENDPDSPDPQVGSRMIAERPTGINAMKADAVRAQRAEKERRANEMLQAQGMARQNRRQGMANPYGGALAEQWVQQERGAGGDRAALVNAMLAGGQAGAGEFIRGQGNFQVANRNAQALENNAETEANWRNRATDAGERISKAAAWVQQLINNVSTEAATKQEQIRADANVKAAEAPIKVKQMEIDEARRLLSEGKSPEQLHMEYVAQETKAMMDRGETVTPQKAAEIAERAKHFVAAAKNAPPPPPPAALPGQTVPHFRPEQIAKLQEVFDRNDPFRFKKNGLAGFLQYIPGLGDEDWEEQFMRELEYELPGLEITPEQARAFYKNRLAMENSALPFQWD